MVLFGGTNPATCPTLSITPSALNATPPVSSFADWPALSPILRHPSMTAAALAYQARIGFTYDTWTLAYERDGFDQDGDNVVDQGSDGIDLDNIGGTANYQNGVDDALERETVPPYPYPLRGVQIRIRMYEPGTRQMRQATVENDFITE
jgi:hypothetical protein